MTKKKMLALGCLAPLGLIVGSAVLLGGLVMLTPRHEPDRKEAAIVTPVTSRAVDGAPPLRVDIHLEEGDFTIAPGPLASGLRVSGTYDEAAYGLAVHDDGGGEIRIDFRRKLGWLSSLAGLKHGDHGIENHLTLALPADTPLDLRLHLRRGEANIDLSGLSLHSLEVDSAMGDFEIHLGGPNPIAMTHAELRTRMSEFRFTGLGQLRAGTLDFRAAMGDVKLDWGVSVGSASATIELMMGEAVIRLPRDLRVEIGDKRAVMGEIVERLSPPVVETDPELASHGGSPALKLDLRVQMGEIEVASR